MPTTMQAAMGRWYDMSLAGNRFPVGASNPCALAFDGEHIWVATTHADKRKRNLWQLRACDGALAGGYAMPGTPIALAFDGGSVWVSTQTPSALVRVSAATGRITATVPLQAPPGEPKDGPVGLVFDGTCLWMLWRGSGGGTFGRVRAADATVLPWLPAFGGDTGPNLAFDGARVWVRTSDVSVGSFDAVSGAANTPIRIGNPPEVAAVLFFDGTNLWVGSPDGSYLGKIDVQSGSLLDKYFALGPCNTLALGSDGDCLWQVAADRIRRIRRDGSVASEHPVSGLFGGMFGGGQAIVFDGSSMWILGGNSDVLKL